MTRREMWEASYLRALTGVVTGLARNDKRIESAAVVEHADEIACLSLALMEQREREGRFGIEDAPPPVGYPLKGWANPNAVKRYEDQLARLEEYRVLHGEEQRMRKEADARAGKAESLLKKALVQLKSWIDGGKPRESSIDLWRHARQEGFSDGA